MAGREWRNGSAVSLIGVIPTPVDTLVARGGLAMVTYQLPHSQGNQSRYRFYGGVARTNLPASSSKFRPQPLRTGILVGVIREKFNSGVPRPRSPRPPPRP
jgi:hypothetical protein